MEAVYLFGPGLGYMGFVVDKAALGQVSCKHFSYPCHSLHWLLHNHHQPLSGDGTVGQMAANMPSGLSLTPPQETVELFNIFLFFNGEVDNR
jgi:hypothetical protein